MVVSGYAAVQFKYIWTSGIKIWNALGEGKAGIGCWTYSWLSSKCARFSCWGRSAWLCFSASGLCFLSGASFLQKGQKFLRFSPLPLFQGLQLWLFLDYSFVLAKAQKKKVPFQKKKSKLDGDGASKAEEPRSVESTAHPWLVRVPTGKMVLTTKSLPAFLSKLQ